MEDATGRPVQYGHPFFYVQTAEEEALHNNKNHDYAAGGPALGNFERVSGILGLYPNLTLGDPVVVLLVYLLKQLDAVLWGLSARIDHKIEGPHPRLRDISVYAKLARCILHQRETNAVLTDYECLNTFAHASKSPVRFSHVRVSSPQCPECRSSKYVAEVLDGHVSHQDRPA